MDFYQHAYRILFFIFISIIPVAMSNLADQLKEVHLFTCLAIYSFRLTNNFLFEKNMEADFALKAISDLVNGSHVDTQPHF